MKHLILAKVRLKTSLPEIEKRGFKKVVVVTDKGLIDFKVATKVTEMLDQAKVSYDIYDGIVPNPTVQNVKDGVAFVEASNADAYCRNRWWIADRYGQSDRASL